MELPEEILLQIFIYVDVKTAYNIALSSKNFQRIIKLRNFSYQDINNPELTENEAKIIFNDIYFNIYKINIINIFLKSIVKI